MTATKIAAEGCKLKRRQKESTLAVEEEGDKGIAGNRKQTFRFIERGIVG